MLDPKHRARIRAGNIHLAEHPERFVDAFYKQLFAMAPELRALFAEDMTAQARMLQKTLGVLVTAIDSLEPLLPMLEGLGARHGSYGVTEADFDVMGEALLRTLAIHIPDWNETDLSAWSDLYRVVSEAMILGVRYGAPDSDLRIPA